MKRSHVRLCGSKEQKWCLSCLLQLTLLSMDILVIYKVKWSHKWKKSWQGPERPRGHSINMVFILFICIYMYTCSYVCVCVFSYMWLYMSEVSLARPLAIFRFLFIFFSKTGLSLVLVLQIWSGWLATEPQKAAFCLPSVGMTRVCHHTWCFRSGSVLNHNLVLNSKHFTS